MTECAYQQIVSSWYVALSLTSPAFICFRDTD
jgi:hypothetical protein